MRTYRPRPWRAIAYRPDPAAPNGRRRTVTGRTAATTEAGLRRFHREHLLAGDRVDTFRVSALDELLTEGEQQPWS